MITLVGITGPARNGKDTVGKMLMELCPSCHRFAFADKIKEFLVDCMFANESMEENKEGEQLFSTSVEAIRIAMLNTLHEAVGLYDFPEEEYVDSFIHTLIEEHSETYLYGPHDEISIVSSWRKLFQITGTQWGRQKMDEQFWITPYLPREDCIVTDVRGHGDTEEFKNIEAIAILNKGGVVVRVVDPRKGNVVRSHASEAGIDEQFISHTIVNDGSLEDLKEKVTDFVYTYLLAGE